MIGPLLGRLDLGQNAQRLIAAGKGGTGDASVAWPGSRPPPSFRLGQALAYVRGNDLEPASAPDTVP